MEELIVRNSIEIHAPVDRVWRTLTTPELTRQYMHGCEAVCDWRCGSPLLWKGATDGRVYVQGRIVEIQHERRLEYTVCDPNNPLEEESASSVHVVYELEPQPMGTRLHVSQGDYAGLDHGRERYKESVNAWGKVLAKLKEIAER